MFFDIVWYIYCYTTKDFLKILFMTLHLIILEDNKAWIELKN